MIKAKESSMVDSILYFTLILLLFYNSRCHLFHIRDGVRFIKNVCPKRRRKQNNHKISKIITKEISHCTINIGTMWNERNRFNQH